MKFLFNLMIIHLTVVQTGSGRWRSPTPNQLSHLSLDLVLKAHLLGFAILFIFFN